MFDFENPSTESFPRSSSINPLQTTDEQLAMGSSAVHLSPESPAVDLPDETGSLISSKPPTVDYFIPDGRFVQLIHSEQIPRYSKAVTMQVVHSILSLHPYTSLQTPREDTIRCETFNDQIFIVRCNLNDIFQFNKVSLVFPNRVVLSKIYSSKTVPHGCQQPIQMAASIFMMRRGCVCQ
jgi:hypothetical protein